MSKPELFIYLLKLLNDKYFVYASEDKRDKQIIQECILSFQYVKTNEPLGIIDVQPMDDAKDVDYMVKRYMLVYGTDNVRGGTYEYSVLPDNFQLLDHVANSSEEDILSYSQYATELTRKFTKDTSMYELTENVRRTIRETEAFIKTKRDYKQFVCFQTEYGEQKFDRNVIFILRLLSDIINYKDIDKSNEVLFVYSQIMRMMRTITKAYFELTEEEHKPMFMLKNPEFIFDAVMFQSDTKIEQRIIYETKRLADQLLYTFEGMAYKIINFLDEAEFDFNSYPKNYDRRLLAKLELLNKLIHEKTRSGTAY
jgi:hypothetical protein